MPICNLATSYVGPATLGDLPLSVPQVGAGLNTVSQLNAILLLSFSSEQNTYKLEVRSTSSTVLRQNTTVNVNLNAGINYPGLFVQTSLGQSTHNAQSSSISVSSANFKLSTTGLRGVSTCLSLTNPVILSGDLLEPNAVVCTSNAAAVQFGNFIQLNFLNNAGLSLDTISAVLAADILSAYPLQTTAVSSNSNAVSTAFYGSFLAQVTCNSSVLGSELFFIFNQTQSLNCISEVLRVGFSLFKSLNILQTSTVNATSATAVGANSFYPLLRDIPLASTVVFANSTNFASLNIILKPEPSITGVSAVASIPTNSIFVYKQILISGLPITTITTVIATNSLKPYVALNSTVSALSITSFRSAITLLLSQPVLCGSSASVGSVKFGAHSPLSAQFVNCVSVQPDESKPSLPGRTVTISSSPQIAVRLNNTSGINIIFAIGYPVVKPANSNSSLSLSAILSGVVRIPTTTVVEAKSNLPIGALAPTLLVLGAVDYPDQIQEYVRYPLPTATSAASAVDENGTPVNYSHSVFGSTLLRLTPGANSQAGVSVKLRATQIGETSQYSTSPDYDATLVLLRTSVLDTISLQKAVFGGISVGPDVNRVATYASFPRSYQASVGSMGTVGSSTLVSASTQLVGTYSAPTVPMLFIGSTLVRHNYNQAASILKPSSVATDYYYPEGSVRKITKARIETTSGTYSEGLSPIYSAPAFRLLSPSEYLMYSAGGANFRINAAILAQDGTTISTGHVHASDAMMSFLPIKQGARYAYSRYRPSAAALTAIISTGTFEGTSEDFAFSVSLSSDGQPVSPDNFYSNDADCVIRIKLSPDEASGLESFVYIDIPVIGISTINTENIIIDQSYRWFIEQCLPGGSFASTHTVISLKDFYSNTNAAPSLSTKAVLAVTRPILDISGDQGESSQNKLSSSGDRNLLMGEFSVAISRPNLSFYDKVKVSYEIPTSSFEVYSGSASSVSSFDPNSLHIFIKSDGTLGCRRVIQNFNGPGESTDPNPILPKKVKEFIAAGGFFSQVKVGESVIALLSSGGTGKKLFLWGYNTYGHLDVPAAVDANFLSNGYISNVKNFDFNAGHIAVILDNGQLHSWGNSQSTVWRALNSPTPISNMVIGENFSVAIVERFNSANPNTPISVIEQYGDCPSSANVPSGVTAATPTEVWEASAAGHIVYAGRVLACGKNHAVLLKNDNTVVCWGDNTYGQSTVPVNLSNVIAVDAGDNHTIALKNDNTVVCWGDNTHGQITVPAGLRAKSISAGGDFCVAIRTATSTDVNAVVGSVTDDEIADTAACWGRNNRGQCNVPTCEGISYDPTFHKYRMRFWAAYCGWDHTIGVRKDEVQAKWVKQHPELNRLAKNHLIKLPLKSSSGDTIFDCLKLLNVMVSESSGNYIVKSITGVEYELTSDASNPDIYISQEVVVDNNKYRFRYDSLSSDPFVYIQWAPESSSSWQTLYFNKSTYDSLQDTSNDTFFYLAPNFIDLGWDGISSTPAWKATVVEPGSTSYCTAVSYSGQAVNANDEYIGLDYATADSTDTNLNQSLVAWGNPMAWDASTDATQYTSYYPPGADIASNVGSDIFRSRVRSDLAFGLNCIFSYVGYGKQLGVDLLNAGIPQSAYITQADPDGPLKSSIYVGPRSLEILDNPNNSLNIATEGGQVIYALGAETIFISVGGSSKYFNRPTAITSNTINLYASPERSSTSGTPSVADADSLLIGFNNKAIYVERFSGNLPAGYSIVPNSSAPQNTPNSATGYHILFSGNLGGSNKTLVMTGAYVLYDPDASTYKIYIPFDPIYGVGGGNIGLPSNWLGNLSISVKKTRVVKHQLEYKFNTTSSPWGRIPYPGKHLTAYKKLNQSIFMVDVGGLAISTSSPQVTNETTPLKLLVNYVPNLNLIVGGRSAVAINKHLCSISNKSPVFTQVYGDNSKGQLNLKLFGPFAITSADLNLQGIQFNPKWLMNYDQTKIGHTEIPTLNYGFKKVSCGSFHTLAIDEDGYVHAKGLNNAINPPVVTVDSWDPILFSKTGCSPENFPALLTGYFSNLSTENFDSCVEGLPLFYCNRAPCSWPAGSDNKNLTKENLYFEYPNVSLPWSYYTNGGCTGSYTTNGALLFNKFGFYSDDTLIKQRTVDNIFGLTIGLEHSQGQGRLYLAAYNDGPRIYSSSFDPNPHLVYLYFPAPTEIGDLSHIKAKIDGEYITWDNDDYLSPGIYVPSYKKFLHAFGDTSTISPTHSTTTLRAVKPTTTLTKMAAGDNFFAGIYLQESDPRGRIRGTIAKAPQGDSHTGTHEVIVGETKNIDQGPMFPSLDFSGPKNYFISLVTRTYKSISANLPTGSVYSGAIPAVMQYTGPPTNPSFKIQIGSFYQDPTDPLTYSDDSGEGGQWPKIVLPGDSDWQTAENPLYVYSYRKLGTNYNPDEFQFRTGNPSSYDDLSYPAYPIVSNNFANEFSTYVVYDTITRKLLPQAYEPVSIPTFPNSVALGQQCAFAITSNNSVFSWGHNHQLQRSTIDSYENTNVNMIAASYNGAVVLMSSGLVQVVGFTGIESMQPPHDLPSSSYVAATNKILAAIAQNENSVTCWGEGPDEYNLRTPPQDLAGACTQISGGKNHFAALRSDGKVICWGDNTYNQCSVPPLAQSNVVKVVCGAFHTVALKNNGQVICWGSNNWEQSNVPVNLGIGCLDIAAGQYHTVAIKSNRTLSAWGAINNAETTPTDLCIKLGTGFSSDYAVAVRNTAGTMISWGASDGHPYYYTRVPTAFSIRTVSFNPSSSTTVGPYKHVVISAPTLEEVDSAYNSMPVSIRAKNENKYYTPSELLGLEHAIAVDSGNGTYYAIKAASYNATQGTLVAWGAAGSDNALTVPTGSNFVSVSSRNRHAAARRTDNTIACWGLNSSNQAINPTGTYSSVACGDTFTVAIDSTTDKLTVWGSISVVPAPYSNIKFSTVSAGKAHIVGRALASYSEYVTDGMFSVSAGAVLAFGDNSKGQCNVPGFAYSGLNRSFVSPAVAGGDFTAYELATNGFNITPPVEGSIVFLDNAAENPESDSILDSERLEGHFIHKSGLLCPTILPSDHPFAINRPVTGRTPTGEATTRTVLYNTGFTEIFSLTTNATNVPSEFRRVGGSKKAKLIAAGRYRYHTQGLDRYPYGAGYSVLISEDNEVVVFGGDLLPSGCSAQNYDAPLEAIAIRNTDGAEITPEDDIIQISTYRGNIYALKSTGHLAHWGYDDVSSQYNPEFYRINDDLKKYFSLPDNSLQDVLPRLTQFIDSNIALSYISGIPNVTDSWSVDVYLNRYFNGQETNIKRFSAVGQSSLYGISNPVHFAETFLAIDTWPGEAQSLNSQYVLSIVPRGVSCTVNSASMFALNLDSKVGIQRVFRDGANMGSDMTQPADFLIAKRTGSNFTSSPLTLYNPVVVTAVTDSTSGIMLTSSSPFVSPSFIRNSYGGSAKLEFVNSWGTSASTGGRVAYPVLIDPSDIAGIKAWFKYETLPTTIGNFVSTWASSITAESINLAQSSAVLQPNVVSFNTSFFGAQFDNSNIDFLSASVEVSESSFTYFLVYSKPATSQNTHCAFGKYALPAAGSPRVQGIGFSLGRPVLLVGQTNDIATSAVSINTPGILCGYYGGTSDKGLRLNGTAISSYASVQNVSTMPNSGVGIGYHLGRSIAGPTTGLGNHDANDVYAEVVAVERRLTNAEIEIIEGFLAHKFNLQGGLPAGHTYKAAPPVYDSLDSIYPIDFLQDPFMLLESNRMTTSSGRSETWVGMFEVGVRHNTKRTANSGTTTLNHHAPLLAEFGVTIGITINPILEPITAVCNTTANLTVDSNSKYLVGRCECRSNVISAFVAKQKVLTSSLVLAFSSVTSFALTTRIGLRGFVFANLGVFGCEDYDLIYGCLGASNLGVDLTVSSPKEVLAPINAVLVTRASNFTRIVTLRFGIVECKLRTVVPPTGGGPQRLLNGSCFAISATNTPTLRTLNTRFEAAGILCVSKIQVCLPAFNVILRGSSNKPILPQPPVFPNTPID